MKGKNVVWWYLAVVFVLSYLWQLVIYLSGGIGSVLFPFLMLFPALVAILRPLDEPDATHRVD
jgi:hypothetical protein